MNLDPEIIFCEESHAGQRIDQFLAEHFAQKASRTYLQKLIADGNVLINHIRVKKRHLICDGDEIEATFPLEPELALNPENIPLDILFEDEYLLAVNKPAGMVVHPAVGNWTGTFANALLYHCKELPSGSDPLRPGIVHRLDKETSGILLASKHPQAHRALVDMFAARAIKKEYLAITVGKVKEGEIRQCIGRDPTDRKKMAVQPHGRSAISHVKLKAFNGEFSLAEVRIETGRTHQIRVHLRAGGTPVLGDEVYGFPKVNKDNKLRRQMLHARSLEFKHPLTGEALRLSAPLPDDLSQIILKLFPTVIEKNGGSI